LEPEADVAAGDDAVSDDCAEGARSSARQAAGIEVRIAKSVVSKVRAAIGAIFTVSQAYRKLIVSRSLNVRPLLTRSHFFAATSAFTRNPHPLILVSFDEQCRLESKIDLSQNSNNTVDSCFICDLQTRAKTAKFDQL
jgi:O-phosphoseryl-tRNA(Cys) synthetase